jgi:hypothetical protein
MKKAGPQALPSLFPFPAFYMWKLKSKKNKSLIATPRAARLAMTVFSYLKLNHLKLNTRCPWQRYLKLKT